MKNRKYQKMKLDTIKEKINNKELLDNDEINIVVEFINTTDDYYGAMELYALLQYNINNLVKVHSSVSKKIIDIAMLRDNLVFDESFFEKLFKQEMKYPLKDKKTNIEIKNTIQYYIENYGKYIKNKTKNQENYLEYVKSKLKNYIT